jgi:hypothetical protein
MTLGGQSANPRAGHFYFGDMRIVALPGAIARPLASRRVISQALTGGFRARSIAFDLRLRLNNGRGWSRTRIS